MTRAKILLSGSKNLQNYVDAVKGVGAEGVAKYLPEIDTGYDGLILCGGGDMDPGYYNEQNCGSVNIDSERDRVEFALLRAYALAGKPVMGICRGHQLINVFFGGSLHQHLPEYMLHTSGGDEDLVHKLEAAPDSILGGFYGTSFSVNSSHHQAVKAVGEGLRAVAWSGGCIEAIEHTSLPIFGVQWHPERMCFSYAREDAVCGAKIFDYFISLCR